MMFYEFKVELDLLLRNEQLSKIQLRFWVDFVTITGQLDNCSSVSNESNSTLDSLKRPLSQESIRKTMASTAGK